MKNPSILIAGQLSILMMMTWDPKPETLDLVGYILIAHLMSGGYFFMRYRK